MIKVGITGGIGSGKTIVARIFESLGVPVYNADLKARIILNQKSTIDEIIRNFGHEVLGVNKEIDRKALANIVFNDPRELRKLNSIIHPKVYEDFTSWANTYEGEAYIIQESAILFESGFTSLFDKIIAVSADTKLRIQRVISRDSISESEVISRMKRQLNDEERESKSDYTISNNDEDMLLPQVLALHNIFISL